MTATATTDDRQLVPLLTWLAGLAAAVALLLAIGHGPLAAPPLTRPYGWATWARNRQPVDVAVAVIRLGLLATTWYLLAVTTTGILSPLPPAAHHARRRSRPIGSR